MAGGPLVSHSPLLKNVGFGAPSQEAMGLGECVGHMTLRWTAASVLWLCRLMTEIGLSDWVCTATVIFSDNVTAIDWATFGKITPGNNYLALGYHQTREWIMNGEINPGHVRGWDDISYIGTKPVEKQVIGRLLMYYVGFQSTLPEYTPPLSKKQKLKAAADAVNLLMMGIHAAYVEEIVPRI